MMCGVPRARRQTLKRRLVRLLVNPDGLDEEVAQDQTLMDEEPSHPWSPRLGISIGSVVCCGCDVSNISYLFFFFFRIETGAA